MAVETAEDLAPTDTKTGADADTDTSLIDAKLDEPKDGKPVDKATSPDKANPEPAKADKPVDAKPVVPEKYEDPKLPEGVTLSPELKAKFDPIAKEMGLTQAQYQKVVDVQAEAIQAEVKTKVDQFNQTIAGWKEETKTAFGNDTDKTLQLAAKGIDKIFQDAKENKEFREMLSEGATGLGNWKLMVKAFAYVGKAISEDKFVEGTPGGGNKKSAEEVIYDHPSSVAARKQGNG